MNRNRNGATAIITIIKVTITKEKNKGIMTRKRIIKKDEKVNNKGKEKVDQKELKEVNSKERKKKKGKSKEKE